jgi:hypothetical protein
VLPKKKKDSGGRGRKIEGSRPGGWKHGSCGRVDPVIKPYYCQKKKKKKKLQGQPRLHRDPLSKKNNGKWGIDLHKGETQSHIMMEAEVPGILLPPPAPQSPEVRREKATLSAPPIAQW